MLFTSQAPTRSDGAYVGAILRLTLSSVVPAPKPDHVSVPANTVVP